VEQLTKTIPMTTVDEKGFDDDGVNKHPGRPGTGRKTSNNCIQAGRNRRQGERHTFKFDGPDTHRHNC
jgi:hypothetical protein